MSDLIILIPDHCIPIYFDVVEVKKTSNDQEIIQAIAHLTSYPQN